MTQYSFGTGALFAERTDQIGNGIGPMQFAMAQDIQVNFETTSKPLFGQTQVARIIPRSQMRITGTVGFVRVQGLIFAQIYFGQSAAQGMVPVALYERVTVPATPPYQLTVNNASNYVSDLGVFYSSGSNAAFNRVTTPVSAAQYTVNPALGAYTFTQPDANATLLISYAYNNITSGIKIPLSNQYSGVTPIFKATFYQTSSPGSQPGAAPLGLILNACTASKLSLPTKLGDWTIQKLDFEAMEDASGNIGTLYSLE